MCKSYLVHFYFAKMFVLFFFLLWTAASHSPFNVWCHCQWLLSQWNGIFMQNAHISIYVQYIHYIRAVLLCSMDVPCMPTLHSPKMKRRKKNIRIWKYFHWQVYSFFSVFPLFVHLHKCVNKRIGRAHTNTNFILFLWMPLTIPKCRTRLFPHG